MTWNTKNVLLGVLHLIMSNLKISRFILTFGGYDGSNRLNTIEKYIVDTNEWILLDLKLP